MITRKEFGEIIKIDGKVRGSALKTDAAYIMSHKGEQGLQKIEEEFRRLGYPIEYRKFKDTGWYPLCLRILSLLIIKDTFKWSDEDLKIMGDTAPKYSFIVKFFMKFTGPPKEGMNSMPKYWKMHYTIGDIDTVEINEQKRFMKIRLKDFKTHPLLCRYLEGYFRRLLQFNFLEEKVDIEETKCMFRGDPYHEYKLYWRT